MTNIIDISLGQLALAFALLGLPIALLVYYKIKLVRSIVISAGRMIIQLFLVAIYLEWVFAQNNAWLNSFWVLLMILVNVLTILRRTELSWRIFILPLIIATCSSLLIVDAFYLGLIIKLDYIFDAQYFIPLSGMILGNAMAHNIIGLNTYYKGLREKIDLYYFLLTNMPQETGLRRAMLVKHPFLEEALRRSLAPLIATMSVIGLISLPGMMTGQILAGSSPITAIKYQIMIMLAIFISSTSTLFLSIILADRYAFDEYDNLKDTIFKKDKT